MSSVSPGDVVEIRLVNEIPTTPTVGQAHLMTLIAILCI